MDPQCIFNAASGVIEELRSIGFDVKVCTHGRDEYDQEYTHRDSRDPNAIYIQCSCRGVWPTCLLSAVATIKSQTTYSFDVSLEVNDVREKRTFTSLGASSGLGKHIDSKTAFNDGREAVISMFRNIASSIRKQADDISNFLKSNDKMGAEN